jgi:uncharacterized protein YndB with AHSA1/START domain
MSSRDRSHFVYVTVIRTTPEKLWEALTDPEFTYQYWFGIRVESAWATGATWTMRRRDGSVDSAGEVVEIERPRRLVVRWRNEWNPELKAEGASRCTFELEPMNGAVKLTVTHEIERSDSKLIRAVAGGWPLVLSNLKSFLETGTVAIV